MRDIWIEAETWCLRGLEDEMGQTDRWTCNEREEEEEKKRRN